MYENTLFTKNKTQHLLLKGKALEKRGEEENRVALIFIIISRFSVHKTIEMNIVFYTDFLLNDFDLQTKTK